MTLVAQTLTPPFAVAAALLVVAGLAKLRSPQPTADALGWGSSGPVAARAVGLVEIALGTAALIAPGPLLAFAVAAAYLGFAGQVMRSRARGAGARCGCFGAADVPAHRSHVVLNLACAAVASVAVVETPHGVTWMATLPPATAVALALGLVAATYAGYLAFTAFPAAWAAFGERRA